MGNVIKRLIMSRKRNMFDFGFFLYLTMMSLPCFALIYIQHDKASIIKLIISLIFSISWYASFRNKKLATILALPFFLIIPFDCYYITEYGGTPNVTTIQILVETNMAEARGYIAGRELLAFISLTFIVVTWVVIVWSSRRVYPSQPLALWSGRVIQAGFGALLIVLAAATLVFPFEKQLQLFGDSMRGRTSLLSGINKLHGVFPFGRAISVIKFCQSIEIKMKMDERLRDFSFGVIDSDEKDDRKIFVLVIGEASRSMNWQLFGYERQTNPKLMTMEGVIPLPNMVTPWAFTAASLPVILSRKPGNADSLIYNEKSIFSLFAEARYQTYLLSNQARPNPMSSIYQITREPMNTIWTNIGGVDSAGKPPFDEELLAPLQAILNSGQNKQFIVVHLIGSHDLYELRYPAKFEQFETEQSLPRKELLRNSYDNSILYTDYILSRVIHMLHGTSAVSGLYYVADHGENLLDGQCNRTGHGSNTVFEYSVSAFVWLSPAYLKNNTIIAKTLMENAEKPLTTEVTFHSLAGMAGIEYLSQDNSRNLFSPEMLVHPRMVNTTTALLNFDNASRRGVCQELN
jgi:glucan phosphoethanolaminetransferase (alkaline phosphatase superfamily)